MALPQSASEDSARDPLHGVGGRRWPMGSPGSGSVLGPWTGSGNGSAGGGASDPDALASPGTEAARSARRPGSERGGAGRARRSAGNASLWVRRARTWLRVRLLLFLHPPQPVHYISGSDPLPPPLTPVEADAMIRRLAAGDTSVKPALIERNLRLVVYIARRFDNTRIAIEDLISIGAIGLIKAVNSFDPDKRIKLATYASKCIENEILMYLRRSSRTRGEVSFDQPLNVDWDGNELLLQDIHGTDADVIYRDMEEEVDRAVLRRALTKLTRRERRIVELRYGLQDGVERTQKQVADCLGISQSYISRLEKRIIRRLRKEMQWTG